MSVIASSVIAFRALSLHSIANDSFWISVCLLSEAISAFLDNHCSVHAGLHEALLL